jgi:type VI secretion system protein ImpB
MSNSYQNEIPKARVNIKLDVHTGGAARKMELPLKLLVTGDFSNGQEDRVLSEREKVNVNKNNFDSVLADFSPSVRLTVPDTLSADGSEQAINLTFSNIKDFEPEQVARQIPQLKAMLAMRNLLRDLMALLHVYLGAKLDARLELCVDRTLMPDAQLSCRTDGAQQLGRTTVLPLTQPSGSRESDLITIQLGRYQRVRVQPSRIETDEQGNYRW